MLKQTEIQEKLMEKIKEEGVEINKAALEKIVRAYNEILKNDLIESGKTKIPGIGNVEVRYRAAREGKNPRTKETIQIEECLTAGLKASDPLKAELAEKVDIAKYRK